MDEDIMKWFPYKIIHKDKVICISHKALSQLRETEYKRGFMIGWMQRACRPNILPEHINNEIPKNE